ncbi:MAG: hypothetical protein JSW63_09945, partial [Ignavibacterium sp.]
MKYKLNKTTSWYIFVALLFTSIVFQSQFILSQEKSGSKTINIAVVRDGPFEGLNIIQHIKTELDHLLGDEYNAVFDESLKYDAGWQKENFRKVIENALADANIDFILGIGALVTQEAASEDLTLTKTFLSATLLNGDIPPLPYSKEDRSLKENLSLVILPQSRDMDIYVFKSIVKFDTLYVGLGIDDYNYIDNLYQAFEDYESEYKAEFIPVPVSEDIESTLSRIDENTNAFYLYTTPRLSSKERGQLVDSLVNRGIPVFSGLGLPDIKLGVLATNKPDMVMETARRVSINLFRLIRGENSTELPVLLLSDFKLLINGKTAAEIGYYPDYDTRVSATIYYREYLDGDVKDLNIREALKLAEEGNTSLSISS